MSDTPQGRDWWQASDLKWYPPRGESGGPAAGNQRRGRRWLLPAALMVVVALIAAGVTFVVAGGGDTADASVLLEPVASTGPDPFTESVVITEVAEFPETVEAVVTETVEELPTDDTTGTLVAVGTTPGLYGGTGDEQSCDAAALNAFLSDPANAEKATAWAQASGIPAEQITERIASLTSTVLTADTWVTNNGYESGRPTPRQAVLQAGTAVMIDGFGVPRVKCGCGNPLAEPAGFALADATVEGSQWADYTPAQVATVDAAPETTESFTVLDVESGDTYQQAAGSALGTIWVATSMSEPDASGQPAGGTILTSTDGLEWEMTAETDVTMSAVAHGDGLFVAIGTDGSSGSIYTSTDAMNWEKSATIDDTLEDVTFGNGVWVALGRDRAWTSTDGTTWTEQAPIRFDDGGDNQSTGQITYADGQFLMFVETSDQGPCRLYDLLSSPDGAAWTRSPIAAPDPQAECIGGIAAGPDGTLAAVGTLRGPSSDPDSESESIPKVWRVDSEDVWQEVTHSPAGLWFWSLSAGPGGWYAVATDNPSGESTEIYRSADLSNWERVGASSETLRDLVVVTGVVTPEEAPEPEESSGDGSVVISGEALEVVDGSGGTIETLAYDDPDALIEGVKDVLGEPDSEESVPGDDICVPDSRVTSWGDFSVSVSEEAPPEHRSALVGLRGPEPAGRVTGPGGVVPGMSYQEALAASPGALQGSPVQDYGYFLAEPSSSDPMDATGVLVSARGGVVQAMSAPLFLEDLC